MGEMIPVHDWAPIVGLWDLSAANGPIYQAPQQPTQPNPFGICVSDIRFSEGEIRATIYLPDQDGANAPAPSGRILLGYRSPTEEYVIAGLGGYGYAYTISHFEPAHGWRALAVAGSEQNLRPNHGYRLVVRLRGQRLSLEVNNVRVLDHVLPSPLGEGQMGLFAWGQGLVQFTEVSAAAEPGTAFVVMKFSPPYQELYDDVIKPVVNQYDLRAYHVGDVFGPGLILDDIVRGIIDAKVVIADITPTNENVFYELGYAHALKKPTILLAEKDKVLPFDISGFRCLKYENSIGGKRRLVEGLRKHLKAILN